MENPIVTLAERVQKEFGKSIETRVVDKTGPDHCPTIIVEIELPDGTTYKSSGSNQKEAKKIAAQYALDHYEWENYWELNAGEQLK